MNSVAYFEIQADDCKRAVDFYSQIFGWKITLDPNLPVEYWRIEGEPRGGLLKRPVPVPQTPAGTNAFACSIQVENFDEMAKKILEHGGLEALPKFAVQVFVGRDIF
jgi:uncharacterized protein